MLLKAFISSGYIFALVMSLLSMVSYCQTTSDAIDLNRDSLLEAVQSQYKVSSAIWDATIYSQVEDTLYVGKSLTTSKIPNQRDMSLPDSLSQLVYDLTLNAFEQSRKKELESIRQFFGVEIYLDENGVLKETQYTLPNKFKRVDSLLALNELDLMQIDQALRGTQLVLPEWWKEFGYARLSYGVKFHK